MTIGLHNLTPSAGRSKSGKRLGRGIGSGKGRTSGRGMKGQKSRSGVSGLKRLGMRKTLLATPKVRGFNSPHSEKENINIADIAKAFSEKEIISTKTLKKKGLIRTVHNGVKILGDGEIDFAVKIKGCKVTKSAAEKITKAGGEIA
ncbi:50S ribosomal protein L15 [Patescibacteria group bacterium]|nr:50S ribosomal protein L15 [Patescibacteria group bacterium]